MNMGIFMYRMGYIHGIELIEIWYIQLNGMLIRHISIKHEDISGHSWDPIRSP